MPGGHNIDRITTSQNLRYPSSSWHVLQKPPLLDGGQGKPLHTTVKLARTPLLPDPATHAPDAASLQQPLSNWSYPHQYGYWAHAWAHELSSVRTNLSPAHTRPDPDARLLRAQTWSRAISPPFAHVHTAPARHPTTRPHMAPLRSQPMLPNLDVSKCPPQRKAEAGTPRRPGQTCPT